MTTPRKGGSFQVHKNKKNRLKGSLALPDIERRTPFRWETIVKNPKILTYI